MIPLYRPVSPVKLGFHMVGIWCDSRHCLRSSRIQADPTLFRDGTLQLIPLVLSSLENGMYVRGIWDSFHVPGSYFFQQLPHKEPFVIFGANRDRQSLLCYGCRNNGCYEEYEIPFSQAEQAILTARTDLMVVRVLPGEDRPDPALLQAELQGYLHPPSGTMGIHCWADLGRILRYSLENSLKLDEKHTDFLCMHQDFTQRRIRFLAPENRKLAEAGCTAGELVKQIQALVKEYNQRAAGQGIITANRLLKEFVALEEYTASTLLAAVSAQN